jgi:hypothetical protein
MQHPKVTKYVKPRDKDSKLGQYLRGILEMK